MGGELNLRLTGKISVCPSAYLMVRREGRNEKTVCVFPVENPACRRLLSYLHEIIDQMRHQRGLVLGAIMPGPVNFMHDSVGECRAE